MTIPTINVETLKAWLDKNEVLLVDVREADEYAASHIPGALLLPLSQFSPLKLPEHPGKKLVIQCLGGKRSAMACQATMIAIPGIDVYNLEGGINSWAAAGFAIVEGMQP